MHRLKNSRKRPRGFVTISWDEETPKIAKIDPKLQIYTNLRKPIIDTTEEHDGLQETQETIINEEASLGDQPPREGLAAPLGTRSAPYHKSHGVLAPGSSSGGWKPTDYPSPLKDPVKCGITTLIADENSQLNESAELQNSLLYCDPDMVLEESYKQLVIDAMTDFNFLLPVSDEVGLSMCGSGSNTKSVNQPAHDGESSQFKIVRMPAVLMDSELAAANQPNPLGRALTAHVDLNSPLSEDSSWTVVAGKNEREAALVPVEVAVAVVTKIDLSAVLKSNSFYAYEDEDDLINEAAQYFARFLHDTWHVGSQTCGQAGILIFLSIQDRVCYISTGSLVESVVPWWRLEYVVGDIKPILRRHAYGDAILKAIDDIRFYLDEGPPTTRDRMKDFFKRFGLVIGFAVFTFAFALWGEYRDRFRRWQYTERRSKMSGPEKVRAKLLQEEYSCRACPICLEEFPLKEGTTESVEAKTVDPLPTVGSDGLPLKLLRCGHVFDLSCWKCWVDKGQGNPLKCPICRQDIGGKTHQRRRHSSAHGISVVDQSQRQHRRPNYNSFDVTGSDTGNAQPRRGTVTMPVRLFPLTSPYGMDRYSPHLYMFHETTTGEHLSLLSDSDHIDHAVVAALDDDLQEEGVVDTRAQSAR